MKGDTFFDTWAWVAIVDADDQFHEVADTYYKKFLLQKRIPITSDYILAESFTLLRRRVDIKKVINFGETLFKAISVGRIRLEIVTQERRQKSWAFFKKYSDKPEISFFDLTSMVIMQELGIKQVFSGDDHFEKVNLGFKTVP